MLQKFEIKYEFSFKYIIDFNIAHLDPDVYF